MLNPVGPTPAPISVDWWEDAPKSPGKPNSPASGLQYLFKDDAVDGELMPKSRDAIDTDLKGFEKYIDSPKRKERGQKIGETLTAFGQVFSRKSFSSVDFHRHTYKRLFESPWAAYRFLKPIQGMHCQHHPQPRVVFPAIVNIPHIVDGDENGGIHFCHPGTAFEKALRECVVNNETGVFTGHFKSRKKEKFSTFFPHAIRNEQELLEVVQKAKSLYKQDKRVLCVTTNLEKNFYLEMYVRHEGACIHSAFPLFFFGVFEGKEIDIPALGVFQAEALLAAAKKASEYKYRAGSKVIIDVAPFFKGTTKVDQGIYISFPKELVP